MWALRRLGEAIQLAQRIVTPGEGEWPIGEESLEHMDRLLKAIHAHLRLVKRHPGLIVFRLQPATANAQLETAAREQVERGRFLRQHDGVPVVVVEDETADAQPRGRACRVHQRRDRRELITERLGNEVVADEKRRKAKVFGAANGERQLLACTYVLPDDAEAEWALLPHSIRPLDSKKRSLS